MHKLCAIILATLTATTLTLATPINAEALEHTVHITSEVAENDRYERLFGRKLGGE